MNELHNSSSSRRFFLGGAFFFCLLAGIWLLTDVVFRTIGIESKSTVFETEHVKGLGLVMARRNQLGEENINEQGLRRKGTLPDPLPEEIRILVLGDSSAWGVGLEIQHAWPTMLEKLLRDEGIPATVMNGAKIGKGFNGIYFDFLWYKKHLAIDLVIIHGWWEHAFRLDTRTRVSEFSTLENARTLFPNWPLSLKPNRNLPIRKIDGSYLEGNYFAPKAIVRLANFSPLARYLNERVFPSIGKVLSQSPEFIQSEIDPITVQPLPVTSSELQVRPDGRYEVQVLLTGDDITSAKNEFFDRMSGTYITNLDYGKPDYNTYPALSVAVDQHGLDRINAGAQRPDLGLTRPLITGIIRPKTLGQTTTATPYVTPPAEKILSKIEDPTSKETFQFFTGLILREAALSHIPVITVRPMSVFRIPGILETDFWEQFKLEAFNLYRKDYKELREQIEILDSVIDLFSETNHTLVIDPQRDFFDNVDLRNISTIQKLFTDHNHFHVSGNMLLAKFIKRELLNGGFLKKVSNDPWSPKGKNADFFSAQ